MKSKESLKIRSTLLILIECSYISLGTFYSGYNIAVFNQSQACIEIINEWSPSEQNIYDGLLTSLLPLGAIFGAFITAIISEKIGKRMCLILMDLIAMLGSFVMIFNGDLLFVGRFITGIPTGANLVTVSSYINEISPPLLVSKTGAIISVLINFGIFLAFVFGLNFPSKEYMLVHRSELQWWRFMLAFPILTCLIRVLMLLCFVKTDTPDYYISRDREEDAKNVLKKYYEDESAENVYNELKKKHDSLRKSTFFDLFSYKTKKRLFIGLFLSVFQQFSGINAVIFYSNEIFMNSDKGNDLNAKVFTSIIGLILIITAYFSGRLLEKLGRRSILLWGEFFCTLTLFLLTLFCWCGFEEPTKYLILAYIFSFGLSLGPVIFVYIPEILPEKGMGISIMANWFSCFLIGLLFPILLDKIDIAGCFLIFCITSFLGLVFVKYFVLETKAKSKEEVEVMFMSKGNDLTQNEERENTLE